MVQSGPDENNLQSLMSWDMAEEQLVKLGQFLSPPFRGEIRWEMHPGWSRDETRVCFDSIHDGTRQVYVLDVSAALERKRSLHGFPEMLG